MGGEWNGPEDNEVYNNTENLGSFDDLDDDVFEDNTDEVQGTRSFDGEDGEEFEEVEDGESEEQKQLVKDTKAKKEAAKNKRGQKSDDLEALDTIDEEDEEKDESKDEKKPVEKAAPKESEVDPKADEGKEKAPKGKSSYVTIDGETFALDSNAVISTQVNGKNEKVSLQDLKNNYAGKVAWDEKFNELNLKDQGIKREQQVFAQKIKSFEKVQQDVMGVLQDPNKNPKDALKIFLDAAGVDSYDLMERMFKADLEELYSVLSMEPAERKAYFSEKRNNHLSEQLKKRDEQRTNEQRTNLYAQKVNALRNSLGVSEIQYVDALEELISFGTDERELTEQQIVEWAATKPHRATVVDLLEPYKDQFGEDAYGELSWKLAKILLSGKESKETIQKHLKDVYGEPTEVRELSNKLKPVGRKPKPVQQVQSKKSYSSFDDFDDE